MISRRDFLQVGMAAASLYGLSGFGAWAKVAAQQALTQDQLLEFDTFGNVSLIHVTDIHAQLMPIYFREPEINIGVGGNKGHVPHLTGADFRKAYGVGDGTPAQYALTYEDFSSLPRAMARLVVLTVFPPSSTPSARIVQMPCCWMAVIPGTAP